MSTESFKWPDPAWLSAIPDGGDEQLKARVRLYLSLACIYYTDRGTASSLAEAIGMTPNAFALMKSRGEVPPRTAVDIEKELGRKYFPREVFRPDLFSIEG